MDNWKSVEARSYSSVIIILLEGRDLIHFQGPAAEEAW